MTSIGAEFEAAGPPYLQVAAELKAAIERGDFPPGSKLPSQEQLATRFDVARGTIQQALKELHAVGVITSRRGSGTFVQLAEAEPETKVDDVRSGQGYLFLRPILEEALADPNVTIDFSGLTAETLYTSLTEPLARVRQGQLAPESITIRLLLPSDGAHLAIPRNAQDPDDPRPMDRMAELRENHIRLMHKAVEQLVFDGRIKAGALRCRKIPITPTSKLYLFNGRTAVTGYYQISKRQMRVSDTEVLEEVYDVGGVDATLFRNDAGGPGSADEEWIKQSQQWFDSMWDNIAADADPF